MSFINSRNLDNQAKNLFHPGSANAIHLYKERTIPEVGLHLTLTSGKPLSDPKLIPDLVNDSGYFLTRKELTEKPNISSEQITREFAAQYRLAIESGLQINHIDSHHFAAVYPALKDAFINFSNNIGLPVRRADAVCEGQHGLKVPCPDVFDIGFYDEGVSLEWLKNRLLAHKANSQVSSVEFMCHPGYKQDSTLQTLSSYVSLREKELEILTSVELKKWLGGNDIESVGFNFLSR
ncbi:ChbG/HpnK family deacetylase [Vibrio breoganii]|uniref:ChbG/HpnK family deacetylase n=1 Tax=Vibrio breoganii TaxID=553239 RepID=UPI0030D1F4D6